MTWVRLDDGFADHPKIVGLSDRAYRAFVDGLCYCARYLTDGHIPAPAMRRIAGNRAGTELMKVGLWEMNGDGVNVHDYLEFQPSRSKTEANREARASAGAKGGLASGRKQN